MDPEFTKSAAVDSFVDGICDWEVQLIFCVHSCKNITALSMCWKVKLPGKHYTDLTWNCVGNDRESDASCATRKDIFVYSAQM